MKYTLGTGVGKIPIIRGKRTKEGKHQTLVAWRDNQGKLKTKMANRKSPFIVAWEIQGKKPSFKIQMHLMSSTHYLPKGYKIIEANLKDTTVTLTVTTKFKIRMLKSAREMFNLPAYTPGEIWDWYFEYDPDLKNVFIIQTDERDKKESLRVIKK